MAWTSSSAVIDFVFIFSLGIGKLKMLNDLMMDFRAPQHWKSIPVVFFSHSHGSKLASLKTLESTGKVPLKVQYVSVTASRNLGVFENKTEGAFTTRNLRS